MAGCSSKNLDVYGPYRNFADDGDRIGYNSLKKLSRKRDGPTIKSLKTISFGVAMKISAAVAASPLPSERSEAEEEKNSGICAGRLKFNAEAEDAFRAAAAALGPALTSVLTPSSAVTGRKRGFFKWFKRTEICCRA